MEIDWKIRSRGAEIQMSDVQKARDWRGADATYCPVN